MTRDIGWWWAIEPFGEALAWALTRVADGETPSGPVAAGVVDDASAVRGLAARARPAERGDPWSGPLTDPRLEHELAAALGGALLPGPLREELTATDAPRTDTVTIAVRGWPAALPWDCLAVDSAGTRLVEVARVLGGLPATVHVGRARNPGSSGTAGPAVRIVDPGPSTSSDAGGRRRLLLYPNGRPTLWESSLGDGEDIEPGVSGDGLTVREFGDLLSNGDPGRLLYFGHAVAGSPDAPAAAALVLADDAGEEHLFRAFDWLAAPERFPAPPRVALIGCGSDDSEIAEQSGLPIAAVNAGAELVTATRWVLPLDRGPDMRATTDLALAVDSAHGRADPVEGVRAWQLRRLNRWRAHGELRDAPLVWGSLVTYLAPGRG